MTRNSTAEAVPSVTTHSARRAQLHSIPVAQIHVVKNVRTSFDTDKLKELAESIKVNGVIQPLLVRPVAGRHELVAGERRLRAAKMAGLEEVPCVVRAMSDAVALEAQLIENTHREDMNGADEAFGVRALVEKLGLSHEAVGERLGRSPFYVTTMVTLTKLPRQGIEALRRGLVGKTAAYEIAKLPERTDQIAVLAALVPDGYEGWDGTPVSVRRVKALIREVVGGPTSSSPEPRAARDTSGEGVQRRWRYWLLTFTEREFVELKRLCRGRSDESTIGEAVSVIVAGRTRKEG